MSDFRQLSFCECAERLLAFDAPQIVMHVHPDGDTVGSAAALAHAFLSLGKRVRLLCADPIPERLAFLTEGLDFGAPEEGRQTLSVDIASPAQMGALREILTGELAPKLQIDHHERGEAFADALVLPDAAAAGEIVYSLLTRLEKEKKIPALSKQALTCLYASLSSDTGGFFSSLIVRNLQIVHNIIFAFHGVFAHIELKHIVYTVHIVQRYRR